MAKLTKAQIRTAIQQAIDDPSAKRWSTANLDILTGLVQDTMYTTLLDTFDDLTSNSENVTPTGSGTYDISGLAKRFYRVQKIVRVSDSKEFQAKRSAETFPQPTYDMLGDFIRTTPAVTGATSLTVQYSYLPTKFNDLALDSTVLPDYPEGHELALIYLTASAAIIKGDAESMQQIARLADVAVEALLQHIARRYPVATSQGVQQVKFALLRNPVVSQGGI